MAKKKRKRKQFIKHKAGKPPGTLLYMGESEVEKTEINFVEYNEEYFSSKKITGLDELKKELDSSGDSKVRWLNVNGIQDAELISKIGEIMKIHPLVIEDVLNAYHRPKIDLFDDYSNVIAKYPEFTPDGEIKMSHVSIFFSETLVVTFQDGGNDMFKPVYERIEFGKNIFRKQKSDYLFYVLIDIIVDQYSIISEEFSEKLEELEDKLLFNPEEKDLTNIRKMKSELQKLRSTISPVRDILASILRGDTEIVCETVNVYFRDTLDHQVHLMETFENDRDSLTTLLDVYLSSVSNRMNEVMKVLTIIATIFIPLTFIAGLYGMNFNNMPELQWEYGYPVVLFLMLLVGVVLLLFFKKKNWL
ncbi:MAG: magnesium/cobalt transporter CorA [Melioribacteraceae bacterium]|nr:magnesium/cobalt transporter CorA [Melioribacteraceae bacterium]MCF8354975.1 magnesium/cobalt transporter CorA [Melioribacteraceae bacterium]MCF8394008.1 magnesium/cobalt transporter CorA [Melioribacteraceae bacterium]MCF8419789.1 magnesium/cobalt transporter CorA [Melioribacteraceae bacterium]